MYTIWNPYKLYINYIVLYIILYILLYIIYRLKYHLEYLKPRKRMKKILLDGNIYCFITVRKQKIIIVKIFDWTLKIYIMITIERLQVNKVLAFDIQQRVWYAIKEIN